MKNINSDNKLVVSSSNSEEEVVLDNQNNNEKFITEDALKPVSSDNLESQLSLANITELELIKDITQLHKILINKLLKSFSRYKCFIICLNIMFDIMCYSANVLNMIGATFSDSVVNLNIIAFIIFGTTFMKSMTIYMTSKIKINNVIKLYNNELTMLDSILEICDYIIAKKDKVRDKLFFIVYKKVKNFFSNTLPITCTIYNKTPQLELIKKFIPERKILDSNLMTLILAIGEEKKSKNQNKEIKQFDELVEALEMIRCSKTKKNTIKFFYRNNDNNY